MNALQFAGLKVEIAEAYVVWAENTGTVAEAAYANRKYAKCLAMWYHLQGMVAEARIEYENAAAFNRQWVAAVERQRQLEQRINF